MGSRKRPDDEPEAKLEANRRQLEHLVLTFETDGHKALSESVGSVNSSIPEDVDLAEVMMQLQLQQVAYQAALAATARVLQPSLADFLR